MPSSPLGGSGRQQVRHGRPARSLPRARPATRGRARLPVLRNQRKRRQERESDVRQAGGHHLRQDERVRGQGPHSHQEH